MVYGANTMVLVEINMLTWPSENFNPENNQAELGNSSNMINEIREMNQI